MQELKLTYKNSSISYCRIGNGSRIVFCFHGYGETGRSYEFFEKAAGNQFTYYAIDLPFHGKTLWNEGLNFSDTDLLNILASIKSANNFSKENKFYIMGYSLGGRIALRLYQLIPQEIEKTILLAPDGLKLNFWYWFSTQTWAGNKLFSFTMKYPGWFFGLLKLLNKLGWVNSSIFKFVNYYIGDAAIRKLLYRRWTSLRKIKPHLPTIKALISKNKTQTRLIYGRHDRIILPVRGEKFRKRVEDYCTLSTIHAGHQLLHEKHLAELLPALLQ